MDVTYWSRAATSLARNLKNGEFRRAIATAGLTQDAAPAAQTSYVFDVFPELESIPVDLGVVRFGRSNLDPLEQYVVGAVVQRLQPKRILEIGTYDGSTTALLARSAPGAEILTLDLPSAAAGRATVAEEVRNAAEGAGKHFSGGVPGGRITQLWGDSRDFDFSPWFGSIDLVLVDGGHEYDCARADTLNALRLIAPGGVIIWDDYQAGWPGVVQAVDEMTLSGLVRIAATDLAIYAS